MRWIRLALVLAGIELAGRFAIAWAIPTSAAPGPAFYARLVVVPLAEAAAIGAVLARRRPPA